MGINAKDTDYEKKKFKDTKAWVSIEKAKTIEKCKAYEEKTAVLKKSAGGSYSIDLILAENTEALGKKNLKKLTESENNPYFARIDFKEKLRSVESFYIGKFGLIDEDKMEEIVIDWRAPIANLYYSGTFGPASYKAPIGEINGELLLKRKFQVKNGEIVNIFDEGIDEIIVPASEDGEELIDEFLKLNLEENMNKKLKDVVTTIQREQNEIIRAYKNKPIIIQGSAGSGKTTVALHRLAYLVYTYGDEMDNKNILVVAPNELFLDYISDILPNLGVSNVKQTTFEKLCCDYLGAFNKLITKDHKLAAIIEEKEEENVKYITAASKIKGTISFKVMMDRLVKYLEKENAALSDILVDEFVLFSKEEINKLYLKDLINLPINKRRIEIEKYFKGKLKNKVEDAQRAIEDSFFFKIKDIKADKSFSEENRRKKIIEIYDERDGIIKQLKPKATKALKEYFNTWKNIDPIKAYYNFFEQEEVFNNITTGAIPQKLASYMREEVLKNKLNEVIDSDDLSAMTYLKLRLEGLQEEKYIHTVIDEAQDYSMMQLQVLKEFSQNNSMTIVGDLGQGIYSYKGINSWEGLISKVFKEEATYITLSQSYRSTVEIIEFANKALEKQELGIKPAAPILRHGPKPQLIRYEELNEIKIVDTIVQEVKERGKRSIAVIAKDLKQAMKIYKRLQKSSTYNWFILDDSQSALEEDLIIIPSYMTKGLEFDATIVYDCDNENYKDNLIDKKLLYVALTRALHLEYIMYQENSTSLIS